VLSSCCFDQGKSRLWCKESDQYNIVCTCGHRSLPPGSIKLEKVSVYDSGHVSVQPMKEASQVTSRMAYGERQRQRSECRRGTSDMEILLLQSEVTFFKISKFSTRHWWGSLWQIHCVTFGYSLYLGPCPRQCNLEEECKFLHFLNPIL